MAKEDTRIGEVEYKWRADMRGRPPYKRERVDIAAMEVMPSDVATEDAWVRELTDRPPFQRHR